MKYILYWFIDGRPYDLTFLEWVDLLDKETDIWWDNSWDRPDTLPNFFIWNRPTHITPFLRAFDKLTKILA